MTGYKPRMRDELESRYSEIRKQSIRLANQALRMPDVKLAPVDIAPPITHSTQRGT